MVRPGPIFLALAAALGVAACNGCRSTTQADSARAASSSNASPTIRLYVVSNLAGALEPCGCTKDQLGGIDHLAAFIAKDRAQAKSSLLVAVGPTMFLEPKLQESRGTQDRWKGEAIGAALGDIGLAAWTPGFNDWAGGVPLLAELGKSAQGPMLAANIEGATKSTLREVGGVKVGIAGVSAPAWEGARPAGVVSRDPTESLKEAVADLRTKGAKVTVGLAAVPRGEALRLAEMVSDLTVLVVGKPLDGGEANDAPPPPVLVGSTLVVGTSNHLQTVGVVDLFVHDGDYHFQDATGVANAEALASIDKRIRDLEARLEAWKSDSSVRPEDIAARRADLAKLKEEKGRLSNRPPPQSGSYFRTSLIEVREGMGSDPKVHERMTSFYRRVNDHNRSAFAGRKPPEVARGGSGYVGVEVCSSCHEESRKVWDKTAHARAYATLSKQFKEYNLDCVSCHVTGYEKPGGSTVTLNESLRDVQCEECHGPGQSHAKAPKQKGLILREPKPETCVASCHHPPHVEGFDPVKAKAFIVGPGHGMPDDAPWPAWALDAGR
jgi:Cytochrome c554 and c-prime